MKKMMLIGKGMLFGIIGALIGGIPNSVLKTFVGYSDFGEICFNSFKVEIGWDLVVTPCGLFTKAFWSVFGTFVPIIVGGPCLVLLVWRLATKEPISGKTA